MSRTEKDIWRGLKEEGVEVEVVKHPAVAGALNLLPGVGNFYLASGTEETDQWLYGFLNLLCWPASVVWGVPAAVIDANTINKKETVWYSGYRRY